MNPTNYRTRAWTVAAVAIVLAHVNGSVHAETIQDLLRRLRPISLDESAVREIAGTDRFEPCVLNPVLSTGMRTRKEWDAGALGSASVIKVDGVCHMYYEAWGELSEEGTKQEYDTLQIGHAISLDGVHWAKDPANPIVPKGSTGEWDQHGTWDPFVIYEDGIFKMWYGGNQGRRCEWGYATSQDGSRFEKKGMISQLGNVEDIHVVHGDQPGTYLAYYWDRAKAPWKEVMAGPPGAPSGLFVARSKSETDFAFGRAQRLHVTDQPWPSKQSHVVRRRDKWFMFFGEAVTRGNPSSTGLAIYSEHYAALTPAVLDDIRQQGFNALQVAVDTDEVTAPRFRELMAICSQTGVPVFLELHEWSFWDVLRNRPTLNMVMSDGKPVEHFPDFANPETQREHLGRYRRAADIITEFVHQPVVAVSVGAYDASEYVPDLVRTAWRECSQAGVPLIGFLEFSSGLAGDTPGDAIKTEMTMTKRSAFQTITMTLLAAWLPVLAAARTATAAERKPNVVFILADDLGIGDVKCYGGERCQIDTPHIDALASGGLRFTDAHVNASVCVPTRVAIMTGRYPWRFGKPQPGGPWGLLGPQFDKDTYTLGKMFQGAGYRAAYIGKWHLGTVMTTKDGKVQNERNVDYTQPLLVSPPQYGFDDSFILPGSLDMYPYAFARNNVWQGEVTAQKGWSAFHRVGPAAQGFQDHEVLATFYHETESFIGQQQESQPFFLYLALTAPHTPTSPGEKFQGRSSLGLYGDFVMEVDHAVQRVLDALKGKGLYDNTLVIFSSDHGAAPYAGNILKATPGQIRLLEKKGHYSSGPHRGYKFSVYEGGLRVPLIAHWPGVIQPGGECGALVGLCDLMATFATLADGRIGPRDAPDSISFDKLLRDPKANGTRKNLVMQSVHSFIVRDGDWKLCLCPGCGSPHEYGNTPTSDGAWREAIEKFGDSPNLADLSRPPFVQLFNLDTDLHEDQNLATKHPERVAEMVELLRRQIQLGRSTPGPRLANDRESISIHHRIPK